MNTSEIDKVVRHYECLPDYLRMNWRAQVVRIIADLGEHGFWLGWRSIAGHIAQRFDIPAAQAAELYWLGPVGMHTAQGAFNGLEPAMQKQFILELLCKLRSAERVEGMRCEA